MRVIRRAALTLGIVLILSMFGTAAAGQVSELDRFAAELSQYTSLEYYKAENTERYIDYKALHQDLGWETVVTYVNIGLDTLFYTNPTAPPDPNALNVLVNKYHPLPSDYVPVNLETINPSYSSGTMRLIHDARVAFEKMCADAKKLGYTIYAISSYRSYAGQKTIYDSFFDAGNPDSAYYQDLRAARPGYSEHQTGLAVDIAQADGALTGSDVYNWYSRNAHKYGYIVRYPKAMESVIGYSFEPWHLRYLGVDLATAVYESGLTYDEYYAREFEIPASGGEIYAVGVTATETVTVAGTPHQLSAYHILGSTYFDFLDIAAVLSGSQMQFDLAWDNDAWQIVLLSGMPYTGDPASVHSESGQAGLVTAAALELYIGDTAYVPAGYTTDRAYWFKLDDILLMLGAHTEDDGTGGFTIVQGS